MAKSPGPFVCQSHSPSQQCPPPLMQGKPRCAVLLSSMTLLQVSMEKVMRRRTETSPWHEVNLWCMLCSKKQMVFQTAFFFFFLSCVTYKLRSAEAPIGLPLKKLELCRNTQQQTKEEEGKRWRGLEHCRGC